MITIDTQEQLESLLDDNGNLNVKDNLTINIDISIRGDIKARHIDARHIDARNIKAWNIDARHIDARHIKAWNIDAFNIDARHIKAWNILARNIKAKDISYNAVCFAYDNITCNSIEGRRDNSKHFVLDGELKINIKGVK